MMKCCNLEFTGASIFIQYRLYDLLQLVFVVALVAKT